MYVSAVDKDGGEHGIPDWPRDRFSRTVWRSAPFRPGAYPPAPRSYAEAVAKCGDEIFERPATQYFLKTGKPDPDYKHNCYPAKMHSALIHGMLGYAARRPDRAADALKLARIAADYLISISHPKGAPLEYWPPTYADRREAGSFRYGQNMLIYPCAVGAAYLALHDRVKDAKYLDAARRIADTYVRLQEPDGTWPIFIRESDGKVLSANRVQPAGVVAFLEKLYRACGEAKYRACGDRAFAWIEAHPLTDWFWEGQFEDAPLIAKYENPSKHPACELALYLLERYPGEKKWLAVARDILRYAEDQFVCWERPCAANGHGVSTPIGGAVRPAEPLRRLVLSVRARAVRLLRAGGRLEREADQDLSRALPGGEESARPREGAGARRRAREDPASVRLHPDGVRARREARQPDAGLAQLHLLHALRAVGARGGSVSTVVEKTQSGFAGGWESAGRSASRFFSSILPSVNLRDAVRQLWREVAVTPFGLPTVLRFARFRAIGIPLALISL